jgi:hypothetical protein
MPNLSSSAIASVDYENGYLTVVFRDGTSYIYKNVPQSVYEELVVAGSAGAYFNRNIRDSYDTT